MNYKVNILNVNFKIPENILKACNNDELIARIFVNRGIKEPSEISAMIDENFYKPTLYSEFSGMKKAVDILVNKIEKKDKIAIYGDYDVDGVTSTTILYECLNKFTDNIIYHVPDRFTEGYGMNKKVVEKMNKENINLILTCDCGISNYDEILLAKNLGMDIIITDHHTIPEKIPPADIILNPNFFKKGHKAKNISGCVMSYYLCIGVYEHYGRTEEAKEHLDLVVLSIIADVVKLVGENRYLLKMGLPFLFNTARPGLKLLFSIIEKSQRIETEEDIAFQIAPRINAAGRMDSARLPVELFLIKNEAEGVKLADKINELNIERKRVQQEIVDRAVKIVEESKKNKEVIVLYNEFWHHGIIGIAAGKISEQYHKPAILLSMKDDGNTIVGSARSVEEINVYDLISECKDYLLKYGGHSQAAGLSLSKDKLNLFIDYIESLAKEKYRVDEEIKLNVDLELTLEDIDEDFHNRILSAGPYGEGFPPPKFYSKNMNVLSDRVTDKNHHIMVLEDKAGKSIKAVKWFGSKESFSNECIDVVYKVGINNYKGNYNLQLNIENILESSNEYKTTFEGKFIDYRNYSLNEVIDLIDEGLFYYEGLDINIDNDLELIDRKNLRKSEILVFLSPPVNVNYFREIVSYVKPAKIYINFSMLESFTLKDFLIRAIKVIKYVWTNMEGRCLVDDIAIKLSVEDTIVKALLRYLSKIGKIKYFISDDEVFLSIGNYSFTKDKTIPEKLLKTAIKEKEAFYDYLMKLDIKNFINFL